jgi:transmembrane protein 222
MVGIYQLLIVDETKTFHAGQLVKEREMRRSTVCFSNERDMTRILSAMGPSSRGKSLVDRSKNRYPYSIVVQPFPPLTWCLPLIGHMGITDSRGRVIDFQGPYAMVMDQMMLGSVCIYVPLNPEKISSLSERDQLHDEAGQIEPWDRFVAKGAQVYSNRCHNLICDNCNHHVAHTLNLMGYGNYRHWGMFQLWFYVLVHGKPAGTRGFLFMYGPFIVICAIVVLSVLFA